MKIALVAQHATPIAGDSATQDDGDARLIELSRSLAGKGHKVTVYAGRRDSSVPERAKLEPGVKVEYIGPADGTDSHHDSGLLAQVPAFSRPLHDLWRRERPDV